MMAQECQSLQLRVVTFRGQLNNTVWARLSVLAGWASVVQSCQKQTCSLFENCLGLMARVCCCSATPGSCLFPINYLQWFKVTPLTQVLAYLVCLMLVMLIISWVQMYALKAWKLISNCLLDIFWSTGMESSRQFLWSTLLCFRITFFRAKLRYLRDRVFPSL